MGTVIDGVALRGASAGSELMDHGTGRDGRLADLMRSAQDGDHSAYIQLLEEVTPLLRQTVRRYRHFLQPADVEDLVQDILLSLHAVRATYDPGDLFSRGYGQLREIEWRMAPAATCGDRPTRWRSSTCL